VPGAFDALNHMKQRHSVDLVVVTSRQLDIEEATKSWLDRHYPDLFSKVRCVVFNSMLAKRHL
jgi:uncharacterized HAD superfamily protein